jgi:hypothetical protein
LKEGVEATAASRGEVEELGGEGEEGVGRREVDEV